MTQCQEGEDLPDGSKSRKRKHKKKERTSPVEIASRCDETIKPTTSDPDTTISMGAGSAAAAPLGAEAPRAAVGASAHVSAGGAGITVRLFTAVLLGGFCRNFGFQLTFLC